MRFTKYAPYKRWAWFVPSHPLGGAFVSIEHCLRALWLEVPPGGAFLQHNF